MDVYAEVAYVYDGTLEGMLSAVFAAYANHEDPSDIVAEKTLQPRLMQRMVFVETDDALADRVRRGIERACGYQTFRRIMRASLSSDPGVGTIIYRFIRYAMACEGQQAQRALENIAHPAVAPLFALERAVNNECEKMRQFARFVHLKGDDADFWFAKVNPRDSVIPLVLNHFIERFNIQPFIMYDENHQIAGVWDGNCRSLINTAGSDLLQYLPGQACEDVLMQDAWRRFYRSVAIDARYNPELRRHFMPMRFWRNLTEMQPDVPAMMKTID